MFKVDSIKLVFLDIRRQKRHGWEEGVGGVGGGD